MSRSSSPPADRTRRRRIYVLAGLVAAALAAWLLTRQCAETSREPAEQVAERAPDPRRPSPDAPTPRGAREKRPLPPAFRGAPPEKPIIDEIILEKTEVCEGEENLVTVKAHTPGHRDDQYLHYKIGSGTGVAVPLRSYKRDKDDYEPVERTITVFGRNNVATRVKVPYFRIKDCKVPRVLAVQFRQLPNTEDQYELWAKIIDKAADKPFEPVRYRWWFGDGEIAETTEPLLTHSFAGRSQDRLYSQFLVRCEAVDKQGRTLAGRASVQLLNVAFEEFHYKGIVTLFFTKDPRFPQLDDYGVVEQVVGINHHWHGPVQITRVIKSAHYVDKRGSSSSPEQVSPQRVLGTQVIPVGGIETVVRLDTEEDPERFSIEYTLLGRTEEGHPVQGRFSILRPPELPTRDRHQPVVNPVLKAKILKARKVLGREYVTDEDLFRLEQQGHFDDLSVDRGGEAYPWRRPGAPHRERHPRPSPDPRAR